MRKNRVVIVGGGFGGTLSFGIKAPLDFSVVVDFAAALLLGACPALAKPTANEAQQ